MADRPASRYSDAVITEPVNWNRAAVEVANTARKHHRDDPIGVYQPVNDLGLAVLFGNGEKRYDEDRTARIAVESLRQRFARLRVMEIGFGLDAEANSTWSIVVKASGRVFNEQRLERLRHALKEAYRIARELE